MRYTEQVKETYEQVGDFEYNRINPYAQLKLRVLYKYPNARIVKFHTRYMRLEKSGVDVPILCAWFETEVQCES